MDEIWPRKEDFQADSAPYGGRGQRIGQYVSARPGQPQLAMCQAWGGGPHVTSPPRSKPVPNAVVRALPPLRHECASQAMSAQESQRIGPQISNRQRILREQRGRINQHIMSNWIQALSQLKAEISDMYHDFLGRFFHLMKVTTTAAEREHVRLMSAQARQELFSDMKARIRASCLDFAHWRWRHLKSELEAARKKLFHDRDYDALVDMLQNHVFQSELRFQEQADECAHLVWEKFAKELCLEKEFCPA